MNSETRSIRITPACREQALRPQRLELALAGTSCIFGTDHRNLEDRRRWPTADQYFLNAFEPRQLVFLNVKTECSKFHRRLESENWFGQCVDAAYQSSFGRSCGSDKSGRRITPLLALNVERQPRMSIWQISGFCAPWLPSQQW